MFQVVAVILTLIFHKLVQRRIWGMVGYFIIYKFTAKSVGEIILKNGQYLAKLEAKI